MKELFNQLSRVQADACVTIILNTHRTAPDNRQDGILLKNLIKEAEQRLYDTYEKRAVWPVMERLNQLADSIDHSQNLESLVLFVNADISEFVRLTVRVTDRAVVDTGFATRDLVRGIRAISNYALLVLSRRQARLIEASGEHFVAESSSAFPMESTLYTTDAHEAATSKADLLVEEFFNRVDKAVQSILGQSNLPLVVVTEERNLHHYMKVTDKNRVIGHLNMNRDEETAVNIVKAAWPIVREYREKEEASRLGELKKAVSEGKFLSDVAEIHQAAKDGRASTLFVANGHYIPAVVNGVGVIEQTERPPVQEGTDDIVDRIIETTLHNGGDVVFLDADKLRDFNGLGLVTRY